MSDPPLDVVLVAQNVVARDGQGHVMLELARALLARGHRVTVCAHAVDETLAREVVVCRLPRVPGPTIFDDLSLLVRASWVARRMAPDVICTLGPCVLARRNPVVFNVQFSHRGWRATWTRATRPRWPYRLHAWLAQGLESLCARAATRVIASTPALASEVLGRLARPVDVAPNGIDIEEFRPVTADARLRAREALGVGPDEFVLSFLGDYSTTRKGLETLLLAMARRGGDEVLLIAARGDDAALDRRIEELGLSERARRVGFAPPVDVYAASDVVTVPSLYEPWSLVAVEAGASALPVIVSSVAGAAPWMGEGALVVPPGDPAALAAAIGALRGDPERRRVMGVAGREAASRLGWSSCMEQAAKVVEGVAFATGAEVGT